MKCRTVIIALAISLNSASLSSQVLQIPDDALAGDMARSFSTPTLTASMRSNVEKAELCFVAAKVGLNRQALTSLKEQRGIRIVKRR